jgi:hypothetical protein
LPHLAGQSLSRLRLLPLGQQPSPDVIDVMGVCVQLAAQPVPLR